MRLPKCCGAFVAARQWSWARFHRKRATSRSNCSRMVRSTISSPPMPSAWGSTSTSTMSPSRVCPNSTVCACGGCSRPRWRKLPGARAATSVMGHSARSLGRAAKPGRGPWRVTKTHGGRPALSAHAPARSAGSGRFRTLPRTPPFVPEAARGARSLPRSSAGAFRDGALARPGRSVPGRRWLRGCRGVASSVSVPFGRGRWPAASPAPTVVLRRGIQAARSTRSPARAGATDAPARRSHPAGRGNSIPSCPRPAAGTADSNDSSDCRR